MSTDGRDRAAALTDRSRRRVFEAVQAAAAPVEVAELARACGIHQNTVRLHLERLVHAGLVTRTPDRPRGAGRPPHRYVATGADPTQEAGAYRRLAGLLARAVHDGVDARAAGRAVGAQAQTVGDDPVAALVSAMAEEGFRPTVGTTGHLAEIVLHVCPFAALAAEDPATICQLHLGYAEGTAGAVGDIAVERLDVRDAYEAGCRLVLRVGGDMPCDQRRVEDQGV